MTRFARAKGSRACNEKAPEDGTPWEVMREQLLHAKKDNEEAKKRQEAENQRIENYENFLKERKVQKRNATWCDFPETEQDKKVDNNSVQNGVPNKKKKKKNKHHGTENGPVVADVDKAHQNDSEPNYISNRHEKKKNKNKNKFSQVSEIESGMVEPTQVSEDQKCKKKNKNKPKNLTSVEQSTIVDDNNVPENSQNQVDVTTSGTKIKKKKNKNKSSHTLTVVDDNRVLENSTNQVDVTTSRTKIKKTKNKNKSSPTLTIVDDNSVPENSKNQVDVTTSGSKIKKKKNKNKSSPMENENSNNMSEVSENKNKNCNTANTNKHNKIKALIKKKKKDIPLVDGKPVRRKQITERSFQLIINGKEVELVRFDGFPVMKKDAERLGELRQSMLQKGIPKSEVQRTLKLERRRAEKALARMKRDVCYNCRKGGHNLSDCPELKSKIPGVDAAEGVCFKCGSTEHRQFECKVQRDKEFRFATCFICKEPGHIARQCPDNPKGLYPNGGCCKLCGDVTHLRKDCPTINDKKEESSVKLQTLDTTENLEDIGQQVKTVFTQEIKKPKKIKF